ncbi:hypothetical protein [uncultured Rikenella sp.]|uniref:hypothetical protein n=1 Tax=uncultured Rikenella sp. TaxID=368003 RepID=UPI0026284BDC|nr:hypothetical protein [uncultured Rikenella sp.]
MPTTISLMRISSANVGWRSVMDNWRQPNRRIRRGADTHCTRTPRSSSVAAARRFVWVVSFMATI